jgi:hypothetical protein
MVTLIPRYVTPGPSRSMMDKLLDSQVTLFAIYFNRMKFSSLNYQLEVIVIIMSSVKRSFSSNFLRIYKIYLQLGHTVLTSYEFETIFCRARSRDLHPNPPQLSLEDQVSVLMSAQLYHQALGSVF